LPEIRTTLVSHEPKSGTGQRGPWTLHVFKDSSGASFQTFEAPIGNRVYGLLNQPVVLTYTEKPAKDPQYPPNKVIGDVRPDTSAGGSVAPVAPKGAPAAPPTEPQQNAGPSPTTLPAPVGGGDDRELRIMRQSALERAIRYQAVHPVRNQDPLPEDLYGLAEEFIHYFQTGEYPGKSERAVVDEFADVFPQA